MKKKCFFQQKGQISHWLKNPIKKKKFISFFRLLLRTGHGGGKRGYGEEEIGEKVQTKFKHSLMPIFHSSFQRAMVIVTVVTIVTATATTTVGNAASVSWRQCTVN